MRCLRHVILRRTVLRFLYFRLTIVGLVIIIKHALEISLIRCHNASFLISLIHQMGPSFTTAFGSSLLLRKLHSSSVILRYIDIVAGVSKPQVNFLISPTPSLAIHSPETTLESFEGIRNYEWFTCTTTP